jgi:hypothetical protein
MSRRKTKVHHNRNKRNRRTRRRYRKGGNGTKMNDFAEKVKCCMCERMVNKNETLIPRECLLKYGKDKAHRICQDCWWDPEKGFARENAPHGCPGCIKGLPLTEYKKSEPMFVDLTED